MTAILSKDLAKNGKKCGSNAYKTAEPPGFAAINKVRSGSAARGHLLANSLGGSGIDIRNIVALWSHANSNVMSRWEDLILNVVKFAFPQTATVQYTVRAVYCGSQGINAAPSGLWLETVYIDTNVYNNWFKVWIPNEERKKAHVLYDYTSNPLRFDSVKQVTTIQPNEKHTTFNQQVPFLSNSGVPPPLAPDVYPVPSAEAAGSTKRKKPSSRQLTGDSNKISCGLSCPLEPSQSASPSASPMASESVSASPPESPTGSESPMASPSPPNPDDGGLLVQGGIIVGLVVPFFGEECVKGQLPVQLLKESGYTGCRFCRSAQVGNSALCNSRNGNGKEVFDVMRVLNDDHGLLQCDLAALKRSNVDTSKCEGSSSKECALQCANCKKSSSRLLTKSDVR